VRYAVLSDVHGNIEALDAVLDAADRLGAEGLLCLGDLVGYGASPNEVIEAVAARGPVAVLGNHDEAAVEPGKEERFNQWGQAAIRWTRRRLTDDNRLFLAALPLSAVVSDARLVHACASDPGMWHYVMDAEDAAVEFASFREPLCLFGHSHLPLFAERSGRVTTILEAGAVPLDEGRRYMVNVGSVGQPRDGDPRASFGLFDTERRTVAVHRVPYDVRAARERIVAADLPAFLGDRLLRGQ
jgi:diadenosine tetraphosphatase ApaH/serine/threonine PP2A family protein phosphatase